MKPNLGDSEQSGLETHQPDSLTRFVQVQTAIKKQVVQEDAQQLEFMSLALPGMCTPEPWQVNTKTIVKEQPLSEFKHGFSHASGQNIDLRSSQDPGILTSSVEMQSLQSPGEIRPDYEFKDEPPPLAPASPGTSIPVTEQLSTSPATEEKAVGEEQPLWLPVESLHDFSRLAADSLPELELSSQQKTGLVALYHQETQRFSWLKWCRLEQLLENRLHSLLLARQDMETKVLPDCRSRYSRIRPHERALLLNTLWGRRKAYGASEFVKGVSTGSLGMVHYFVTAMLVYRFVIWGQGGRLSFNEIQAIFDNSSEKGIDSLARPLAGVHPVVLKSILAVPAILGATYLILELAFTKAVSPKILAEYLAHLDRYLQAHQQGTGYWRALWIDGVRESIPVILQLFSVSYKIEALEKWLVWDGALEPRARWQAFEKIRDVAKKGHKIPQWTAMQSLANLAQGISFTDFARLQRAGYSQDTLKILLKIKATALADLTDLRKQPDASRQQDALHLGWRYRLSTTCGKFTSWPRQVYASYLLWTIGQARSWRRQRIPFTLLRATTISLELYFLQKIYQGVIDALRCPDKPGFRFGEGFEPWASDYTVDCFTTRIRLFRTLNPNESVANLMSEISQYHLTDLHGLYLRGKYLTVDEAFQIVQAVIAQGATQLLILDLSGNQLSTLPAGVFQGLDSLETLFLSSNQLSTLPADVFQGLANLQVLYLYDNQLSTLSAGVFQGLDSLETLFLSSNQLSTLPVGVFAGLSIRYLDLSSNQLSTLPTDVFQGLCIRDLSSISVLDLSSNQLNTLPAGAFQGLVTWAWGRLHLYLYDNQFSTLPVGVFAGLSIRYLDLSSNQLSILPADAFQGLADLQELYLPGNQLSTLPAGVFQSLTDLRVLNLSDNQFSTLPTGAFQSLMDLRELYLAGNQLSTLPAGVFQGLESLKELALSSNQLGTLADGTFQGLSNLSVLYLANNNLSTLPTGVFQNLATLRGLYLFNNQLSSLPTLPSTLKALDIGKNPFITNLLNRSFLQSPINNLTGLTELYLRNSGLVSITEGTFEGLRSLTLLDLASNNLSILANGMFQGLINLGELVLSDNQLSTLPAGIFRDLAALYKLDLSGNQLTTLSTGVFAGLTHLWGLLLSDNQLSTLPAGVFADLTHLWFLVLFGNQLSTLPAGTFQGLADLRDLYLSDNQLSTLPAGVFQGLTTLYDLDLSGNQLSTLPTGVFAGLSIWNLDLSSNQLSMLPSDIFKDLTYLSTLNLAHNLLADECIKNITQAFPYEINRLNISYNLISNSGMSELGKILPCTRFESLDLSANPANGTSVMLALQSKVLKQKCEDLMCHATVPQTAACDTSSSPSTAKATVFDAETADWLEAGDDSDWGEKSHQETLTETSGNLFRYDFWLSPVDSSGETTSVLSAPISTSDTTPSSVTITTTSAMLLGVIGLGILLFKSTWLKTLAKHGSHYGSQLCQGVVNLTTRVAVATGNSINPRSFFSAATPSPEISQSKYLFHYTTRQNNTFK